MRGLHYFRAQVVGRSVLGSWRVSGAGRRALWTLAPAARGWTGPGRGEAGRRGVAGRSLQDSRKNIVLLGSPGSGKTTIGQIVASRLGRPVLDIDNDHLEKHWGMPVSQKLAEVGSERFIVEEGKATLAFSAEGHVVSLSGSNPMYPAAMDRLRETGTLVFLDVHHNDILHRLERMKVNRIVGQGDGTPMANILRYRQQFYEGNYDIRVLCESGETPEAIAEKVCEACTRMDRSTQHVSTRGYAGAEDFNDVVLQGLAADGGLFVPSDALPSLTRGQWDRLVDLTYAERALRILELWLHPTQVPPTRLSDMVHTAYNIESFNCHKIFPVGHLEGNQFVQELFHGPTASFKDGALQLMPRFFAHALKSTSTSSKEKYLILVATSGDTGGAVLDGFSQIAGESDVDVMVLYPEDGISSIQKAQMTAAIGPNVHVVGVESDFDFCQSSIKQVFRNKDISASLMDKFNVKLSAANSINWGRLLPQVVYHASAYLNLVQDGVIAMGEEADLCIPTGNFGNILAAYYSQQMGIPWRRLVCASNTNNVLTEFIKTGRYDVTSRRLNVTSSPAIDILKSSNLERFLYHLTGGAAGQVNEWYGRLDTDGWFDIGEEEPHLDCTGEILLKISCDLDDIRSVHIHLFRDTLSRLQQVVTGDWCSETDCHQTIRDTWTRTGYLLDPHTAVAKTVADRFSDPGCPMLISATAHYAKFANDVLPAVQSETSLSDKDQSPLGLLKALEDLNPRPRIHKALKQTLEQPRRHRKVCGANVNEIIGEIEEFLQRRCK